MRLDILTESIFIESVPNMFVEADVAHIHDLPTAHENEIPKFSRRRIIDECV